MMGILLSDLKPRSRSQAAAVRHAVNVPNLFTTPHPKIIEPRRVPSVPQGSPADPSKLPPLTCITPILFLRWRRASAVGPLPHPPRKKHPHTNKRCTESGTDGQQGEVRLNASRPPKPCVAQVRLSVQPRGGESGGIPQFSTKCTAAPHDASVVGPTRVWEFFCHPTTSDAWCRLPRTRTHIHQQTRRVVNDA